MKITTHELGEDVLKVVLDGQMDIAGSGEIDPKMSEVAASRKRVVIDLSDVDFIASIGIRVLVKSAKAIANNGGRMAVYGAQPQVGKVIDTTGVDKIIDLVDAEAEAVAKVSR